MCAGYFTASESGIQLTRFDFVKLDWIMSSGVDPQEGVIPFVRELDFDMVVTSRAPRSAAFENCVRTFAAAVNTFQQKVSAFVPCDSGWTACFAEGFHAPSV